MVLSEASDITAILEESLTVQAWLTARGSLALPTRPGTPRVNESAVLARDAWQAGYNVDICVPSGSPFNDATDYDKTDIWLTRDDTDYLDVRAHCLATVNGLVHRLDADNDGLYVKDGTASFRKTGNAQVGILSFKNVGRIHTVSITPDMVYNPDPTKHYSDSFYLKVPFDTSNKVMGVVIGGYLHLATKDIKVIGSNALRVNMKRIPFLERYMESRYIIDLSALERFHDVSEANEVDYDLQAFYSNECMLELLTRSQSFIIGVEVDHLNTDVLQTTRTYLPGRYYFDSQPLYPLRTQLGLMPAYITNEEVGSWVLRTNNNLRQHRFMNTADFRWQGKVNERRESGQPETYQRGQLIKWFTNRVVIE
ncbi:hypothetical protein D3C86_1392320 [compost metagenome]